MRLLTVEGAEVFQRELATPVVKVMSPDVIFVNPETELGEIIELLIEHKIGAVPVVRADSREIVGIVTTSTCSGAFAILSRRSDD